MSVFRIRFLLTDPDLDPTQKPKVDQDPGGIGKKYFFLSFFHGLDDSRKRSKNFDVKKLL